MYRAPLIALAMVASCSAWACSVDDIKVTQFNSFPAASFTRIVGEVRNNCTTPVEVRLQAVFRMKSGEVIDAYNFNPKPTGVIAAGEEVAFATLHDLWGRKFELLSVRPLHVQQAR